MESTAGEQHRAAAEAATLYAVAEANLRDRASRFRIENRRIAEARRSKAAGTLVTDERGKQ